MVLYQKASTGKVKKWDIQRMGNKVITTWGFVGGAMQETSETVEGKNIGKSNEISPEAQADLVMARRIKKKIDDGYVNDLKKLEKESELKLSTLSKSFAPAKPVSSITADEIRQLHAKGVIMIQRKFDGQRHFIVKDENGAVKVWSRKMKDMTDLVPHIADEMKDMMPNGTVFDAELAICDNKEDRFRDVSAILRSKPEKAIAKQEDVGFLSAFIFDVLFIDNKPVWQTEYKKRYALLSRHVGLENINLQVVENLLDKYSIEDLLNWKLDNNWEGYCIWRTDHPTVIRFDGKPKRCNAYKFKKLYTEDVIVREPYKGKTGRNQERFGGFRMYQIHEGQEIYIGDCGGGFSDPNRDQFMGLDYPRVAEIEYTERLASMKLRYPQFVRFHADKTTDECEVQFMPRSE